MNNHLVIKIIIGFLLFGLSSSKLSAQGAQKIGENPFTLNPSAIFEIESSTKGFLPPRMTETQRLAIATASIGLIVYQTDSTEGLYVYKSTGWTFIA